MAKRKAKGIIILFTLIGLIIAGFYGIRYSMVRLGHSVYKVEYSEIVERYAAEFELDPYFIFAVIKTESDFEENAESNVGARGLMQVTEPTFDWVKTKISDKDIMYDQIFDPEVNIKVGAFLLSYLYDEFGSNEVTLAAYHAGRTAVNGWLKNTTYSKDGKTLHTTPISDTNHYISKVMKSYRAYEKIYENEKGEQQ